MARINERNNSEPRKLFERITFKEFVETHWKPYTVKKKFQVSTLDNRLNILENHILPFFSAKLMREVQPSDISRFLREKAASEKEYADGTMQVFYSILRMMFDL